MRTGGGRALRSACAVLLAAAVGSCVSPPSHRASESTRPPLPASYVEVGPGAEIVAVGASRLLVATARDDGGRPVAGVPVRWVVVAGSVGGFDAVDGGDGRPARVTDPLREAGSRTAAIPYELTIAGETVLIGVGQSWCSLRSAEAGESEVLVFSPDVSDRLWGEVRVTRTWVDAAWEWPLDAEGAAGVPHTLATRVFRPGDGAPLPRYRVAYEIVGGDAAAWFHDGRTSVETLTDTAGVATATLQDAHGEPGWSEVRVTVAEPDGDDGARGRVMAAHVVRRTWTAR